MDILNNLSPLDDYNMKLIENVYPQPWINPSPRRVYDLVVIGGGAAGLTAAKNAADHGAQVALVQEGPLGGTRLNYADIPLASLSFSAYQNMPQSKQSQKNAHSFSSHVNFSRLMERMRKTRSELSSRYRTFLLTNNGIHLFFGHATFRSKQSIFVDGSEIRFKRAILATGATSHIPEISGLADSGYYTHETLFTLTEQPRSVAIYGSGNHACEIGQIFGHLGSHVIIICPSKQILPMEDSDISTMMDKVFSRQGIRILHEATIKQVTLTEEKRLVSCNWKGTDESFAVDALIIAHGRASIFDSLNLSEANIEIETGRIKVDKFLRTTNQRIYAAGDCCLRYRYSNLAERSGRIAAHNALFSNKKSIHGSVISYAISTRPPIARVGLNQKDAKENGVDFTFLQSSFEDVERAVIDDQTLGFLQILVQKKSDVILGATVVGQHAAEIINQITLAMQSGIGLKHLDSMLYPTPSYGEIVRLIAQKMAQPQISPAKRTLLSLWYKIRR